MWGGNFKTAIAGLRRSKWRTVFTMLGVIIGISSVVTVVSLGEGLKHQIVGQVSKLGSNVITVRPGKLLNQDSNGKVNGVNLYAFLAPSTLTNKDVSTIKKVSGVENVVPIDFVTSTAKSSTLQMNNIFVVGTTDNATALLNEKVDYGSFISDSSPNQYSAVLGINVAHQLFNELNPVGHTVNILGQDFIVRGVLAKSSGSYLSVAQTDFNSAIFIPLGVANSLTSNHTNILQILISIKPGTNLDATVSKIEDRVKAAHNGQDDFTVLKQDQLVTLADQVVGTTTGFVSAIAAISLLVGGIGIMDIMLVSVSERTREIGIRKAVGASNRQIMNQFLVEGMALTIGGGVIGIISSLLINLGLRVYTNWQPIIPMSILAIAVSVSVGVGIIFSLAPAVKASRKNPIDALRNE